jgi:general secretion pathway protein A
MYEAFFGLTRSPFRLAPDPHFFFVTNSNREALSGLTAAITGRAGLAVVSGDAGTGKTTLLRTFLASFPNDRVDFSYVLTPTLSPTEFLRASLADFGLSALPNDKAGLLAAMQEMLVQRRGEGRLAVLVADEAHKLTVEVLEELRLLTNFEDAEGKLLQILLSGQIELDEVLRREDLRQFKQRVAYRFAIQPLAAEEVEHYIQHRWTKAGDHQNHPFTKEALELIARYSHGIPRVVNTVCDNALLTAFGGGVSQVGKEQVLEAVTDLDLETGPGETRIRGLVSVRAVPQATEPNGTQAAGGQKRPAHAMEQVEPAAAEVPQPPGWRFRPRKEKFIRLGL